MIFTVRSLLLAEDLSWFAAHLPCARRIPPQARNWLAEPGSLTARLEAATGSIRVVVLREGLGRAFASERRRLRLRRDRYLWVREVMLEHGNRPLVAARTVAPLETLKGQGAGFARLGSRPLGALLFSHPAVVREGCEWAVLAPAMWRLQKFGVPHWARRTLYHIGDAPLLVSEFFLPRVLELE